MEDAEASYTIVPFFRFYFRKTFCRIVRRGSTEEFEPSPYVFTLLNALLWLYYGLTKPDGFLVATVNGFGAIMELIYVVLFIVYAGDHAIRVRGKLRILTLQTYIPSFPEFLLFRTRDLN